MSEDIRATQSREDFFQGLLEHLTVPFLKPIAERFFENLRQVESLIQMPLMMFAMLEIDGQISEQFRSLALNYWSSGEGFASFLEASKTIGVFPAKQQDFIERTLKRQDNVKTKCCPYPAAARC